ncbi:MAG TPA: HAD family phosphatase [Vicinamibacterales bacterium]|nr:HAD family phosphatase [Vicinamibacterales bacterium]
MIAAVVFDFDGVLADSEPLHLRAYQEVFAAMGAALPREEYYARYLGYDDEGVFRAVASARGWDLDEARIRKLVEEKGRILDGMIADGDLLYPGAVACVARLAAEFPLGIASGALRHEIEHTLRRLRLDRHFRFIVAAGDARESKPAPDPYRLAAELHGVPPSACVAIEDSRWGIESARAAGLWCVGITHTYPVSELMEADTIVSSLADLTPELIRSLEC